MAVRLAALSQPKSCLRFAQRRTPMLDVYWHADFAKEIRVEYVHSKSGGPDCVLLRGPELGTGVLRLFVTPNQAGAIARAINRGLASPGATTASVEEA